MADFYYVMQGGLKSAATGEGASSTVSRNNAADWIVANCWPATNTGIQNAMRTLITDGDDGDSLVFDDAATTDVNGQATTGNRSKVFIVEGRTAAAVVNNTAGGTTIFNINSTGAGPNDVTFRDIQLTSTGTNTATVGILVAIANDASAVRFLSGCVLSADTITRGTGTSAGALINNTGDTLNRVIEFKGVVINGFTYNTGTTGVFPASAIISVQDSLLDIDGLTINDVVINNRIAGDETTSQLFNLTSSPVNFKNVTVNDVQMASVAAVDPENGFLRGIASYSEDGGTATFENIIINNMSMDGNLVTESQAWGINASNGATAILDNVVAIGCSKIDSTNGVGGVALSTGGPDPGTITLINGSGATDCSGCFGASGYGTGGGFINVTDGIGTNNNDGGQVDLGNGIPNGTGWYKGGTGDMVVVGGALVNCNTGSLTLGQSIYSHNNSGSPGTVARACITTLTDISVSGVADSSSNPVVFMRNNDTLSHTVTINGGVFNNDGVQEIQLDAIAGATLDVTIIGSQIKGFVGGDLVNEPITVSINYGSLIVTVSGGGQVNLTLTNVTDILGSPKLTTPYANRINLDGDVVAEIDFSDGWSGASSFVITGLPNGLTATGALVSGTITTPTGTFITNVAATNSFGTTNAQFQWTTLTTGDPSTGINITINKAE